MKPGVGKHLGDPFLDDRWVDAIGELLFAAERDRPKNRLPQRRVQIVDEVLKPLVLSVRIVLEPRRRRAESPLYGLPMSTAEFIVVLGATDRVAQDPVRSLNLKSLRYRPAVVRVDIEET